MKRLYRFAAEVQEFFEAQGWQFLFIGGVVGQAWAESRVTKDADLTLITGFGEEEPFVDANLDWAYIREQLVPLLALKEQPGLLDELEVLRQRLLRNP